MTRAQTDNKQQMAALREIGYANNVRRGERDFHIQTEIITVRGIKIKTTVHLKGAIVGALVRLVDPADADLLKTVTQSAILQHNAAVERAKSGKYG